jgi:hypothetical protein
LFCGNIAEILGKSVAAVLQLRVRISKAAVFSEGELLVGCREFGEQTAQLALIKNVKKRTGY